MERFFNLTASASNGKTVKKRLMVMVDGFVRRRSEANTCVFFGESITPVDASSDADWSEYMTIASSGNKNTVSCIEGFVLELSTVQNFVGSKL